MGHTLYLAIGIFVLTLLLVLLRPWNLDVGVAALVGAALALVFKLISIADIVAVTRIVWNATAALVGIMLISAALDRAGFFEWMALVIGRRTGGSGRRLFIATVLLAAAVSTLFTNDGTVLILTPIIYAMVSRLGFAPGAIVAFVFACGFVADAVSTPLVISNLVNIMSADYFRLPFPRYALLMLLPSLASLLTSLIALFLLYRRSLPAKFDGASLPEPISIVPDRVFFGLCCVIVLLLAPAFFLGASWRVPVSILAGIAAAMLLAVGQWRRVFRAGDLLRGAPWHVIIFALGMYVVVYALRNAGLVAALAGWLTGTAQACLPRAIMTIGGMAAALSSTMNNLPATMTGLLAIDAMPTSPTWREALALANVIGCDIGPKITPIGSLATLLWLHELQKRNVQIDWRYYMKVGLLITPPVLAVTLLTLAWVFGLMLS